MQSHHSENEYHHSPSGTRWIWNIFWILLGVTAVEVALGIIQPAFLLKKVAGTSALNILFILLTLGKAYYIVAYFMHLRYERKGMIWTITLPALILIPYLAFILLYEGGAAGDILFR
jgi:cytochrome c oxidase subunit IV